MPTKYPKVEYQKYLGLDQLLNIQNLKSEEYGSPAHDEMLFIIVHQTYELWFKQILTELDSILEVFGQKEIQNTDMGRVVSRLQRIVSIQNVMLEQIKVLETMTPLDFLEFRDYLYPASGFQSAQNRLIENKLGLHANHRLRFNDNSYLDVFEEPYRELVKASQEAPSLYEQLEKWLERTPFLSVSGFDFWEEYKNAVSEMFRKDVELIENNNLLNNKEKGRNFAEIEKQLETFYALFDEDLYKNLQKQGVWRLSFKAIHAALFINIYRDQPALQLPFAMLNTLLDIDENFTAWRYRHALMAHRMLGRKIGTGGSSGHDYLRQATEKHKVFNDLFNLTTFFISGSQRPELPQSLQEQLSFCYTVKK